MKATSGNLSLAQTYHLKSVHYGASSCENCGNWIKNIAEVVGSEDGRHYFIGIDCASTLTGIEPDRIAQAKKIFRKKAQAKREVSKGFYEKVLIKHGVARFYSKLGTMERFYRIQGNYEEFADSIIEGNKSREKMGLEPMAIYEVQNW